MQTFIMNLHDSDGRATGTYAACAEIYFDPETELRVVECEGIFYVCDCEGDAQARANVPSQLHNARHAMAVLEFLKLEGMYS